MKDDYITGVLAKFDERFPKGAVGCPVRGSRPELLSFITEALQGQRQALAERITLMNLHRDKDYFLTHITHGDEDLAKLQARSMKLGAQNVLYDLLDLLTHPSPDEKAN